MSRQAFKKEDIEKQLNFWQEKQAHIIDTLKIKKEDLALDRIENLCENIYTELVRLAWILKEFNGLKLDKYSFCLYFFT